MSYLFCQLFNFWDLSFSNGGALAPWDQKFFFIISQGKWSQHHRQRLLWKKTTYKERDPGRSIIGVSHLHLGGMTQWKKGELSICRLRRCCLTFDTGDCRSLLYSHCGLRYILTRDGVFLFLRIWFHNFDAILNEGNSQNNFIRDRFCNFFNLLKFSISMINNVIAIWQEGVLVQESWMAGRFLWAKFYVWLYQGVAIKYFNVYSEFYVWFYQGVPIK